MEYLFKMCIKCTLNTDLKSPRLVICRRPRPGAELLQSTCMYVPEAEDTWLRRRCDLWEFERTPGWLAASY